MNLSNTPGISQLTHLQDLCLSGYYVDVNLVAPLTKLQKLEVEWVGASGGADQLLTLTGLIDLQQLAIRQQLEPVALSAESYAAVATSQQLTKLDLPWLEEGLVGQVFKVSRCPRLPKLQHLVGCMGWLSNTPGMRQVVNSCPNLQHLDLASMEVVAAEEFDARVYEKGLKALERLSMLTELKLWCGQVDMDMGVWGALARLTGLRRLELGYVSIVQSIGLLQLTTCRQLTQLTGGMLQTVPPFNLVSKAPAGAPPDVWWQLPTFVLERVLGSYDEYFATNPDGVREALRAALSVTSSALSAQQRLEQQVAQLQDSMAAVLERLGMHPN